MDSSKRPFVSHTIVLSICSTWRNIVGFLHLFDLKRAALKFFSTCILAFCNQTCAWGCILAFCWIKIKISIMLKLLDLFLFQETKHLSLLSTVNPEKSVSDHRVVCNPSEGHHTIISHEKRHNLRPHRACCVNLNAPWTTWAQGQEHERMRLIVNRIEPVRRKAEGGGRRGWWALRTQTAEGTHLESQSTEAPLQITSARSRLSWWSAWPCLCWYCLSYCRHCRRHLRCCFCFL